MGNCCSPSDPINVVAAPGNGQITVTWLPPRDRGLPGAITSYNITVNPGNNSIEGANSPQIVPGLINGQAYTCLVTARNAICEGPPATAQPQPVIPIAAPVAPPAPIPPAQPLDVNTRAGRKAISVRFGLGAVGSSPITSYKVRVHRYVGPAAGGIPHVAPAGSTVHMPELESLFLSTLAPRMF
jgi:hypothetical protein